MRNESIGLVKTREYTYDDKIRLKSGKKFGPIKISYETYGRLNEEKNNAILVCHALSGDAHAAGWHEGDEKLGWWNNMIGPGKALDTDKYFVICSNFLGSCNGTTGPATINPETEKSYGLDFPIITVSDMVKVQKKLIDHLGIDQLFVVIGGSLGGMQALNWAISYPKSVKFCVPIATSAQSTPQQIAFNEVRRKAIMADPNWRKGDYYGKTPPREGLSLARMIGHITYLSDESMRQKFGRDLQEKNGYSFDFSTDFEVESYLHYKGNKFVDRFDANSYLYITRAIDYFDLTSGGERTLREAFEGVKAKFLVIAISSDWLYPPYQSKDIVRALRANEVDVTYSEIKSNYGHDSFLVETGQLKYIITNFLSQILVKDITTDPPIVKKNTAIEKVSEVMIESEYTHIPVSTKNGKLAGIITAWDIAKSLAKGSDSMDKIMTKKVITASPSEPINSVIKKMKTHNISALPVIDKKNKIKGIVTSDTISQLAGRERAISEFSNTEN
ncbi:homoserine O-acetyltransferase [candidate division MSBL1 archaeon SCGC-AAA382A13]|uniref:Homoserine O-acetyltransferase n=1 Tax=candidate division MSBL1 archaeon SCGC-AAA382A13 TaxID=1698279 RepID=A0A133VFZ0_9EURY|nr:homoserine O-acetyltransferase [candidate division MSBL1 archaeon SCGC-AAA382A13]